MSEQSDNSDNSENSEKSGKTESLLDFPARVTVKAMGKSSETFVATVQELVFSHLDVAADANLSTNASSGGKYISVNITFVARDQAHLEAIYADLHACKEVVFTL